MKKRKLKKWVKIIMIAIVLIMCFIALDALDKKEINNCISKGNTIEYCKKGLK